MALSGNLSTNKYSTSNHGTIGLYLSWSVSSQSIANNSSTLKWTLKSNGTMSSGYYVQAGPVTVVINGVTVLNQTGRFNMRGDGGYKKTGTITITHNQDGTKNVSMSVRGAIYSASVNCTGSKTFTLNKINRFASLVSAPDFTDVENPVITYNNYAGELVDSLQACISLDGETEAVPYRDIDKLGDSYTFNLTQAERNILLSASPNSNSLSVYFIVKTGISGQEYLSSLNKTMSIVDANPVISGASYKDANSTTTAITLNNQQIIQDNSVVEFDFSSLSAVKYATLTGIEIIVNSVSVSSSLSGSVVLDKTIIFGTINSSSNTTADVVLTDSRGNTTTLNIQLEMLEWSMPTAIITCSRQNNYYSETDLNVDALYSSLDGKNTILIQYQYKELPSGSWSALATLQDNVMQTIILANTSRWDLKVFVTDRIGTTSYNLNVDRGIPIIFFDRLLRAVGINKFPSANGAFDIDGDILTEGKIKLLRGSGLRSILGENGSDDFFRLSGGADANNVGFVELATAKDGNEPILIRQYSDEFQTPLNTLELLDSNGNTNIPNVLNVGSDIRLNGYSIANKCSETEHQIGIWIDGITPIYEKTVVLSSEITLSAGNTSSAGAWTVVQTGWNNPVVVLDFLGYRISSTSDNLFYGHLTAQWERSNNRIRVLNIRSSTMPLNTFTIRYFYQS